MRDVLNPLARYYKKLAQATPESILPLLKAHSLRVAKLISRTKVILQNCKFWQEDWQAFLNPHIGLAAKSLLIFNDTVMSNGGTSVEYVRAYESYLAEFKDFLATITETIEACIEDTSKDPATIIVWPNQVLDVKTGFVHTPETDPYNEPWGYGWRSKHFISTIVGADRWSTASRNRQPLIQDRPMVGEIIELMPSEGGEWDYDSFRLTRVCDVDPAKVKPEHWNGKSFIYGLRDNDKIQPDEVTWGIDPQLVIRASPGHKIVIGDDDDNHTYHEWFSAVTLEGLVFKAGSPYGAMTQTENTHQEHEWQEFRDLEWKNCDVIGGFDFHQPSDAPGQLVKKWGHLNYGVGRSARNTYGFIWEGGTIEGIRREHAYYFHNVLGCLADGTLDDDAPAVLLKDLKIRHCGRTAVQVVSRFGEQHFDTGRGTIRLENLDVEDVSLESAGGGSAFTFAGNHDGSVEIVNCKVRLGCDEDLHPEYQRNITGGFVCYAGGGAQERPTRDITIDGCDFEVGEFYPGEGSARRPNLQVDNVGMFTLKATRIYQHPGTREAIVIGPDAAKLLIDPACEIVGDIIIDGQKYADPDRTGAGFAAFKAAVAQEVHPRVTMIKNWDEDQID